MKKYLSGSLLLLLLGFCSGCKKYSNSSTTNTNVNNTPIAVTTGTWSITSYTQRTEDKTASFAGVNFVFSSDGKLTASGTKTANGNWVFSAASTGYYGTTQATFAISIGTNTPFDKLSRVWNIAEQTNTVLMLDNPEAVEDEHITFSKK